MAARRRRARGGGGSAVGGGLLVGGSVWITAFLITFLLLSITSPFFGDSLLFVLVVFLQANLLGLLLNLASSSIAGILILMLPQIVGQIIGGYVVASKARTAGFGAGGALTVGYAVMSVLGLLLFIVMVGRYLTGFGGSVSGAGSGILQFLLVFFVGAVVQPLIFGAIGGSLAN